MRKFMDPASASLADRFRLALDACDASHARGDHTPVVSEMKVWSSFSPSQQLPPDVPGLQHVYPHVASCSTALPLPSAAARPPLLAATCSPPSQPEQSPPSTGGGGLSLVWVLLAALVLAAVAIFLRRGILAWFRKKTQGRGSEQEDDPQAEDAAALPPLPRVLSRQGRKLKQSQSSEELLPLLPRSLTKTSLAKTSLAKTSQVAKEAALAAGRRADSPGKPSSERQASPPHSRRVSIQEPPEMEEEGSYEEDCLEASAAREEPRDPNFVEI